MSMGKCSQYPEPARTMRKDKLIFIVDYISGSRYAPTWEARYPLHAHSLPDQFRSENQFLEAVSSATDRKSIPRGQYYP